MKKLRKQFQTTDISLSAYYTCMCNYSPCACRDGDIGDTQKLLDSEHRGLTEVEDASWNN